MPALQLPRAGGELYTYETGQGISFSVPNEPLKSRIAFAAAHVVVDPFADTDPLQHSKIDWEKTLEYRHHLWSLGFAVAEAMDTAQRGMGLSWESAKDLIQRSIAESKKVGGRVACGIGTDQLMPSSDVTIDDVIAAYEEQVAVIEEHNGEMIMMASRALAACAQSPEDYARVYGRILSQVSKPVILHWLGDMFDPALAGYWGHTDLDKAMDVCLAIIEENKDKVDGIKISLLDKEKEITMRRRLPRGVRMYTGDDFNYPELIKGDEQGYSDALLGIFDAIAPAAAAAIHALDNGDIERYDALLEHTVPLSRHIFQHPTFAYKTGVVFMAYLNGHQDHFRMLGGAEGARSIIHLADLFVMADKAGLLADPEQAVTRMQHALALAGVR